MKYRQRIWKPIHVEIGFNVGWTPYNHNFYVDGKTFNGEIPEEFDYYETINNFVYAFEGVQINLCGRFPISPNLSIISGFGFATHNYLSWISDYYSHLTWPYEDGTTGEYDLFFMRRIRQQNTNPDWNLQLELGLERQTKGRWLYGISVMYNHSYDIPYSGEWVLYPGLTKESGGTYAVN